LTSVRGSCCLLLLGTTGNVVFEIIEYFRSKSLL
jgi:hypothetical protein